MRRFRRNPLPYLVAAELLVLAALGIAGWQVVTRTAAAKPAIPAAPPPADPTAGAVDAPPGATPLPIALAPRPTPRPKPSGSAAASSPASDLDPAFWTAQLGQMNRENAQWQEAQWRAIDTVVGAARAYLERVVVPAVLNAQSRHPARPP